MIAVKTEGLTKKYKDLTAVDGLNLEIQKGEIYALLGVNGAGKTTAVKMLSCLLQPTGGEAFLCGKSILKDREEVKRIVGVSPQETAVAPNLTVEENLRLLCGIYGYPKEKTAQKTQELVERFGLEAVLQKKAGKLSGGWQRRLSIALALVGEPEVLFLDEPTLGLDVLARSELWDAIREMKGRVTMILTTHYMEEAADADAVLIIDAGRRVASGTPLELKNAYTGDFITLYGVSEAQVRLLGTPYTALRGAYRIEVPDTAAATSLILAHPEIFTDYEITKGRMDDVFLAATGKKVGEDAL